MFGTRIKELRKKKKFTQTDIAKRLGIPRGTYSNYELGNREPDFNTVEKLADIFEVSIDYLLGRTTEEEPSREEEQPDPDKIIAEKLLSYLHQGFTNEEIKKRMDFILDVFTLNDEKSDEWIDFVRDQLIKQKRLVPPLQDVGLKDR
jgi:transcriptional regulator with XRE-family HTH domain